MLYKFLKFTRTFYVQLCPICMWKSKDFAFGCGHQVHARAKRVWILSFFLYYFDHRQIICLINNFFFIYLRFQTCFECGRDLQRCPICQSNITTKIRLYWSIEPRTENQICSEKSQFRRRWICETSDIVNIVYMLVFRSLYYL